MESNVVKLHNWNKPTERERFMKKITLYVGTDLMKRVSNLLTDTYKNQEKKFLNDGLTLYYNMVIASYEGDTIVFPGFTEDYDILGILHSQLSEMYHEWVVFLDEDHYERLLSLTSYTPAEGIGDVIRESMHFYILFLETNATTGRPYLYGVHDPTYLEDVLTPS